MENTIKELSLEEQMKTATITDTTRDYLMILAKLFDFEEECYRIIERDCGEEQLDDRMKKTNDLIFDLRCEVEKMIMDSIRTNVYELEFKGI